MNVKRSSINLWCNQRKCKFTTERCQKWLVPTLNPTYNSKAHRHRLAGGRISTQVRFPLIPFTFAHVHKRWLLREPIIKNYISFNVSGERTARLFVGLHVHQCQVCTVSMSKYVQLLMPRYSNVGPPDGHDPPRPVLRIINVEFVIFERARCPFLGPDWFIGESPNLICGTGARRSVRKVESRSCCKWIST